MLTEKEKEYSNHYYIIQILAPANMEADERAARKIAYA
jgi:hypothetical protein